MAYMDPTTRCAGSQWAEYNSDDAKKEGERRRAGERKEEFDSRIKGLKLRVIVTARFLSHAHLGFFLENVSFFGMDWTHFRSKEKGHFFFFIFSSGMG